MLRLKVIGCAPGMPQPHSASSAYLFTTDKASVLLDTGEGLSSALLRCGVDPRSISAAFISHMHPDHCMGLPLFIQMNYLQKRSEPLDIYVPSEASAGLRQLLDLTYLFPYKLGFDLTIHDLEDGSTVAMGDLMVRVNQNSHLKGHSGYLASAGLPNRMQCFSFVVGRGDKKIVYSGDLLSLDDIIPILAQADLLVVDGMHIDLSRLPEVMIAAGVRKVLLTHVVGDFDFERARLLFQKQDLEEVCLAIEGLEIMG